MSIVSRCCAATFVAAVVLSAQQPNDGAAESFEARFERRFAEEAAALKARLRAELAPASGGEAERLRRRVRELEEQNAALTRKLEVAEKEAAELRRRARRSGRATLGGEDAGREAEPAVPAPSPHPLENAPRPPRRPRAEAPSAERAPIPAPPAPPTVGRGKPPVEEAEAAEQFARLRARIDELRRRGVGEERLRPLIEQLDEAAAGLGEVKPAAEPSAGAAPRAPSGRRAGVLGVIPGPVADEWRGRHGVPSGQGVRVAEVVADSAAAELGLREDDVLLSVDGKPVLGEDDLRAKLRAAGPRARLSWRRNAAVLEGSADLSGGRTARQEEEFRKLYQDTLDGVLRTAPPVEAAGSRPAGGGG
jgi:hypothetical protein